MLFVPISLAVSPVQMDEQTQTLLAVALGWRVLRYTVAAIDERPMQMIEEIKGVLKEIQCES